MTTHTQTHARKQTHAKLLANTHANDGRRREKSVPADRMHGGVYPAGTIGHVDLLHGALYIHTYTYTVFVKLKLFYCAFIALAA